MRLVILLLATLAVAPALAQAHAHAQAQPPAADCGPTPYECAVAQVQRQEFSAALATLERLAAQTPRNLRVLNLLGIALTGAGKPEAANVRFREALAIDPRFAPALRNLAVNEFTLGRLGEAQRHFAHVLAQAPDDEIAHVHLAEIQFQKKDCGAALTHYEKGRTRLGLNPRWTVHYASCLLERGQRAPALALLEGLARVEGPPGDDGVSWFEAGVALGRAGAHAEAARFFGAARAKGYRDAYTAGYNQMLMLIDAGDHEAAIRVAQELFAQDQQNQKRAELYSLVSRAYAKTDRIKDAYDALREATRLEPAVAEHYIDLTMLCLEHENYDLGLEIVDVGLKHRPDASMLYLQRGVVLAMKGSVEQAEQEFDRASRAAPGEAAPYVALAMVWMQRGQTPKAIEMLRSRTRAHPAPATPSTEQTQPVLFYALGIALLRAGAAPDDAEGTEALDAFRTAVRLEPTFAQAQVELGKLLLKRGDVPGAILHLQRATTLEPENAAPAYVLAQAYRRSGETDRARELLARVSKLNAQERGDDPDTDLRRMVFRIVRDNAAAGTGTRFDAARAALEARYGRATTCAASGDLDGAIAELREVVEAAPTMVDARYQLAVALWNRFQRAAGRRRKADLDEAARQLTRAVEQDASQPQFHLVLGQLLAEQQQLTLALDHLKRALALAPDNSEHAYNLGLALRLHGDLDAAEMQFRAALAKNPDHAFARRSLGLVLRQKGDMTAAATELRRAAAQAPDDAQGHSLLGTVLVRLGDLPGAVTALREAVRLDPILIEARVTLAQALAKQGQKEEALAQQAEVQRLNAQKADFGRTLVLLDSSAALLKKGDIPGAIAQRREAVTLSPSFAEAHYELGLALREATTNGSRADTDTEAETAFRQAINLNPDYALAHAALAALLDGRGETAGARAARDRAAALAPCSHRQRSGNPH